MKFDAIVEQLTEQIVFNRDNTYIFSMPNQVPSGEESEHEGYTTKDLADIITQNKDIALSVLSDQSKRDIETKKEPSAEQIWSMLQNTEIGKYLLAKYPTIKNYRISSEKTSVLDDLEFFELYDKWANKTERTAGASMPSFREYALNPNKYNLAQVSGGSTKQPI